MLLCSNTISQNLQTPGVWLSQQKRSNDCILKNVTYSLCSSLWQKLCSIILFNTEVRVQSSLVAVLLIEWVTSCFSNRDLKLRRTSHINLAMYWQERTIYFLVSILSCFKKYFLFSFRTAPAFVNAFATYNFSQKVCEKLQL